MKFPDDLLYTEDHEWLRDEGNGAATLGITEFAQRELGDIVFVEIEPVGTAFEQDDVFGTVEAVKTVSELYMPVSGTLTKINEELDENPELINESPHDEGWMVKIELDDPSELDDLLSVEEYEQMI